jgi:hypothetical protein
VPDLSAELGPAIRPESPGGPEPPVGSEATYVVASRADLAGVKDLHRSPYSRVRVRLVLPRDAPADPAELERRLGRLQSACGCDEGTIAGLLYLIAVGLGFALGPISPGSLGAWGGLVAGLLASLLAGKVIGLALARWRTRSLLSRIAALLPEHRRAPDG